MTTLVHAVRPGVVPRWLAWVGFVVLCNGAGFISAQVGTDGVLYAELARPAWAPPGWLFAPVWTALYTLMGTATFIVWRRCAGRERRTAMTVFGVQLALNMLWSPVFFGMQRYGLATIVIALVLASVTAMAIVYARRISLAGWLVVPLWVWVAFASVLNASIWWLNR